MINNNCSRKRKVIYSFNNSGFYYHLISFDKDSSEVEQNGIYHITATFSNLKDSVFWDSENNLSDLFFLKFFTDSTVTLFVRAISQFTQGDSICVLIPSKTFFLEQFKSRALPFFSQKDSSVKINLRIKKIYTPEQFKYVLIDLKRRETEGINNFFVRHHEFARNKDAEGFFWLEKPNNQEEHIKSGEKIFITYEGSFLNGRFLEKSPDELEIIFNTPDQLLKGLNFVIGKMKRGQTSKIILPSPLAFGESGSANGTVPPFTPLVYKISISEKK